MWAVWLRKTAVAAAVSAIAIASGATWVEPARAQFEEEQFEEDESIFGEGLHQEEEFEEDSWLRDSFGDFPGAADGLDFEDEESENGILDELGEDR